MTHSLPYAVNCSILFTELPLLQRAAAARAAGFTAVEFWWPFEGAVPPDAEVGAFVSSVRDAGVALVGLNAFAGDLRAGGAERGLASVPARAAEFRDALDVLAAVCGQLGCRASNVLYGNRVDGASPQEQDELAAQHLALAARALAPVGGVVLVEALSGAPRYPLRRAADAVAVIDRVEREHGQRIALLADLYHLAVGGDDLEEVIDTQVHRIGHVQVADAPGRGEPGTGDLDLEGLLGRLQERGYDGWVALEHQPTTTTSESLRWLPRERRAQTTRR